MRLWHKDLIPLLPKQQLIAQWRECMAIAKLIQDYGTPRHGLVNKVINYPLKHFYAYTDLVICQLFDRGYKVSPVALKKFEDIMYSLDRNYDDEVEYTELFSHWHDARYLAQCYYNLQEKADCNLIGAYDWRRIENFVEERYNSIV